MWDMPARGDSLNSCSFEITSRLSGNRVNKQGWRMFEIILRDLPNQRFTYIPPIKFQLLQLMQGDPLNRTVGRRPHSSAGPHQRLLFPIASGNSTTLYRDGTAQSLTLSQTNEAISTSAGLDAFLAAIIRARTVRLPEMLCSTFANVAVQHSTASRCHDSRLHRRRASRARGLGEFGWAGTSFTAPQDW